MPSSPTHHGQHRRRGNKLQTIRKRTIPLSPQALREEKMTPSPAPSIQPLPIQTQTGEKGFTPSVEVLPIVMRISSVSKSNSISRKPIVYQGKLNQAPVRILIDSGAMGNFISSSAINYFAFG